MRCDAMRRDATRCDAMRCDAMRMKKFPGEMVANATVILLVASIQSCTKVTKLAGTLAGTLAGKLAGNIHDMLKHVEDALEHVPSIRKHA